MYWEIPVSPDPGFSRLRTEKGKYPSGKRKFFREMPVCGFLRIAPDPVHFRENPSLPVSPFQKQPEP